MCAVNWNCKAQINAYNRQNALKVTRQGQMTNDVYET